MELFLLSNSRTHGRAYLEHATEEIEDFLGGRRLVFVPFALRDHDGYTATVGAAMRPLGIEVTGAHTAADPRDLVRDAEVVFVGGGNSFRLLSTLQRTGLREVIRERVEAGELRYMGSSAGTNMACPTLRTTNDMPIVQPESFEALGLVPFQINPHFLDADPGSTHMGETREQRVTEFLEENDVPVLGMREGAWLRVSGRKAALGGTTGARLFARDSEPRELAPDADLSFLLETRPKFDA
ncbi:dipeptidase PepE [Spirillospora sp. NPDC029432]|uniref:dipeptidase PepE n=1 Tax=Spirillospora sp. NPDC029432 TaxID=3154599 RepID=UPI0034524219